MAMKGGNPKNLVVPTSEMARINGAKGGYAKAKKDRERKQLAEVLDTLLKMPLKGGMESSLCDATSLSKDEIKRTNPPAVELLGLTILQKALKGDMKAVQMIIEILGDGKQQTSVSPLESLAEKIDHYKDGTDDGDSTPDE